MSLEAGGKVRAVSDTKSKGTREWRGERRMKILEMRGENTQGAAAVTSSCKGAC